MAKVARTMLRRAENFRRNVRRICQSWISQAELSRLSGVHPVYLNRLLRGHNPNPGITTLEAIALALEIPLETLLTPNPSDADLRIFPERKRKRAKSA
jgi:transcriptional regulator with XRE-family HTH domain